MPDILLQLCPLPSNVPETIRLRRAFKALLRCYELRCVRVSDAVELPAATEAIHPSRPERARVAIKVSRTMGNLIE
jgi:hypothetical protein